MVVERTVHGGWSRRTVFGVATGVAAAGLVAGCSWFEEPAPPPDPLKPLLDDTRRLAQRYDNVVRTRNELATRLRPILDAHQAHGRALAELVGDDGEPSTPSSPAAGDWAPPLSSSAAGDWASPPSDDDVTDDEVLAELRDLEREGQEEATRACLAASPERAWLLGAIVAARACHVEVLA